MKRSLVMRKIFACLLTAIVLFTVSVREIHYLFTEHHAETEHCENHLHQAETHTDCAVCKFDVSFFTDAIFHPDFQQQQFCAEKYEASYRSIILAPVVNANSLRGPPSLA